MDKTNAFCLSQAIVLHGNIAAASREGTVNVNPSETANLIVKAAEKFNEFMTKGQSNG